MQPNAILAGAAAPQFIRRYRAARVCREYREFLPHLLFGLAKEHPDNLKTSAMNGPGIRLGQLILAAHDRMKALLQITAGLLLCQFAQGGSNKPPVTRIVTRYLSPVIQPGSFGAKPKTLYIASDGYSRTEEEPDPEQGVHGLIIVSEPDVWMINLFDHTGRHIVDPGPTYNVDLLAAVEIAAASEKYHWEISGRGRISHLAREIREGESQRARYVQNDLVIDVAKLDVWWADFFATGEEKYLAKILRQAKHPQLGERAADFMMPAAAAWSFKANCRQHKAVLAFARRSLETNAFPEKKEFLKECIETAKTHSPDR
jgi:hypothetical protein